MRVAPPSVFSGLVVTRKVRMLGQAPATEASQVHGFSTIEKILIISTTISAVGLLTHLYEISQRQTVRENPTPRYQTRPVLAGAYVTEKSMLTHVVEVDEEDLEVRVLCKRVKLGNIADAYSCTAEQLEETATCPACAKRDPRRCC